MKPKAKGVKDNDFDEDDLDDDDDDEDEDEELGECHAGWDSMPCAASRLVQRARVALSPIPLSICRGRAAKAHE